MYFEILPYDKWSKNIVVFGPTEDFSFSVDFDDVNQDRVEAYLQHMIDLLNDSWSDPDYEENFEEQ